jgi:hypothetical protein
MKTTYVSVVAPKYDPKPAHFALLADTPKSGEIGIVADAWLFHISKVANAMSNYSYYDNINASLREIARSGRVLRHLAAAMMIVDNDA